MLTSGSEIPPLQFKAGCTDSAVIQFPLLHLVTSSSVRRVDAATAGVSNGLENDVNQIPVLNLSEVTTF